MNKTKFVHLGFVYSTTSKNDLTLVIFVPDHESVNCLDYGLATAIRMRFWKEGTFPRQTRSAPLNPLRGSSIEA
jgi:hypothetical protein